MIGAWLLELNFWAVSDSGDNFQFFNNLRYFKVVTTTFVVVFLKLQSMSF